MNWFGGTDRLLLGTLEGIPVLRVDQALGGAGVRVRGRIDMLVFARLGVPIIKNSISALQMAEGIHAFVCSRRARLLVHARGGPPKAAAPGQIGLGHGIRQQKVFRRTQD